MKPGEMRPCDHCKGPVAPVFYQITVQQFVVDQRAARRFLGLSMMLGSPVLAEAMTDQPELANPFGEPHQHILCTSCMAEHCWRLLDPPKAEVKQETASDG